MDGKSLKHEQGRLRRKILEANLVGRVLRNLERLEALEDPLDAVAVQRLRAANEQSLKLIDKVLPSLKQVDASVTGEDGGPLVVEVVLKQ